MEKMNDFLKKIVSEIKRTGKEYSADDFYYALKYLGVNGESHLALDIEKFYHNFLESLNNSLVKYEERTVKSGENATHYIAFYAAKKANYKEAVKVYFPVKYEYLISSLKTIFMYLIRNNIKAEVKFHVKETNEGIVVRFYDKDDALPFINYCNSNFILNDLLVKINPFMASIYGIGVVYDDNSKSSFMKMLSELLCEYFIYLTKTDGFSKVSDLGFLEYVVRRASIEEDKALKYDILAVARSIKSILSKTSPLDEKDLI